MATLTLQDFRDYLDGETSVGPIDPTLVAADDVGGDDFDRVDEHTYFYVENTTGGVVTVTFSVTGACDFGFTHTLDVPVPANQPPSPVGPFDRRRFADGQPIDVTYSGSGLNVGVVRL